VTITPNICQAQAMLTKLRQGLRKDKGATAVEYGLLVALIAAAIIVIVTSLGSEVRDLFQTTCTNVTGSAC
jgi:pilus assembly protein Flp/PilA